MPAGALGLLGGTFDPVHYAHLRLAEEALARLPLTTIRWIPSGLPGHRSVPAATAAHRVAMLRLAIAGNPRFEADEADARTSEPVYTVGTLARLRAELGRQLPLVLIIGTDQLQVLHTWRDWRRLFELAHIAVGERSGYGAPAHALPGEVARECEHRGTTAAALATIPAGGVTRFPMTALDISATTIRETIASNASARYLLPDSVLDYIGSHRLYTKEKNSH